MAVKKILMQEGDRLFMALGSHILLVANTGSDDATIQMEAIFKIASEKYPSIQFYLMDSDYDEATRKSCAGAPYIIGRKDKFVVFLNDGLVNEDKLDELLLSIESYQVKPREPKPPENEALAHQLLLFTDRNGGEHIKEMDKMFNDASAYYKNIKFQSVDVNDNPRFAIRFGIKSLPTMVMLVDNSINAVKIGTPTVESFFEFLSSYKTEHKL